MSDYEIQEIRRIRHQISAEHGHSLKKVADYYRQIEEELRKSKKYRFLDEEYFSSGQKRIPETTV